jgi:hypothetical protein
VWFFKSKTPASPALVTSGTNSVAGLIYFQPSLMNSTTTRGIPLFDSVGNKIPTPNEWFSGEELTINPISTAPKEAQSMSFLSTIETAGTKIGTFLNDIVNGAKSIQKIYGALSGPVIAASMAVFYDVVKAEAAAQKAATAASTGDVPVAITLSQTTVGLVQTVVKDFIAGEKTVVADFEALNITL